MEGQQSPPDQQAGSPADAGAAMGAVGGDPANGGGADGAASGQNGAGSAGQYTDINQILDQILNITDQSLDEAQVGWHSYYYCWHLSNLFILLFLTGQETHLELS